MTCDEIRDRLDDLLDGALDAGEAAAVSRHLASCDACRAEREAAVELARRARELPRSVEPARDLWPVISRRIAEGKRPPAVAPQRVPSWSARRRRARAWLWLELVAAAALAVALLVPLARRWSAPDAPAPAARATAPVASDAGRFAGMAILAHSEDGMLQTRRDLAAALEQSRTELDDATAAAVERDARLIEGAIAELRVALERDPMNRRLNHSLASKYQMERELLNRMRRI